MRNFKKMPEAAALLGPGTGRTVEAASGIYGHGPSTMIVLHEGGAHMEPLIPDYTPGKEEYRVVRANGQHGAQAGRVHKAGR